MSTITAKYSVLGYTGKNSMEEHLLTLCYSSITCQDLKLSSDVTMDSLRYLYEVACNWFFGL